MAYPSSIDARVRNEMGSVYGKLYSHAATGVTPAAAREEDSSETCCSSSRATNLRLL